MLRNNPFSQALVPRASFSEAHQVIEYFMGILSAKPSRFHWGWPSLATTTLPLTYETKKSKLWKDKEITRLLQVPSSYAVNVVQLSSPQNHLLQLGNAAPLPQQGRLVTLRPPLLTAGLLDLPGALLWAVVPTPPNSYVKALTPNLMGSGDGAFRSQLS